jgi:hypothetical protein
MNKEFRRMMELAGLAEIKVNDPISNVRITEKSYKDANADVIMEFIYTDSESEGRSEEFSDTLQNVLYKLSKKQDSLHKFNYNFKNLYVYMDYNISDIFELEELSTKENITSLINYYTNNDIQGVLNFIANIYNENSNQGPFTIEDTGIIDDSNGEFITYDEIKEGIEKVLLPFMTLYNQLGNSFTVAYGDYNGDNYLIETTENGISAAECLFDEDFTKALSTFNKAGFLTVDRETYRKNPEVF